jgi:hypothetical protein
MDRYAVVNIITKQVVNVAEWDGQTEWDPGHELIAVPAGDAEMGWLYNEQDGTFSPT